MVTTQAQQGQIIYDYVESPIGNTLNEQQHQVDSIGITVKNACNTTSTWLLGAMICCAMPIYLISRYPQPSNALKVANAIFGGLGTVAAVFATKSAVHFVERDEVLTQEVNELRRLKHLNKEGTFEMYQEHIVQNLQAMLPREEGSAPVQQAQPYQPEWEGEKRFIQSVLRQFDIPASVIQKEVDTEKGRIRYFLNPTPGVLVHKIIEKGKDAGFKAQMEYLNMSNPTIGIKIVANVVGGGGLYLEVDSPTAEPPIKIQSRTNSQQPEYATVDAQQSQQYQAPQGWHPQPEGMNRPLPNINNMPSANLNLPDGARAIQIQELNNVTRYPVMMVVAGQGAGKTATVGAIFAGLSGYKVIGSPKPITAQIAQKFDLIFGCDPDTGRWLNFGSMADDLRPEFDNTQDLSWHLHKAQHETIVRGSMLEFLWACRRESMNRQSGDTENSLPWRVFYDEAVYTYSTGYNDPLSPNGQAEKAAQALVSGVLKDAFLNFRGQGEQMWIGSQVETLDPIGLKNFGAARDEAWHLFPGLNAITAAEKHNKVQLAQWLRKQVQQGQGIALLEKEGVFFEVIVNLPSIAELKVLSEGDQFVAPSDSFSGWDEQYEDGVGKGRQPEEDMQPQQQPQTSRPANIDELILALKRWMADLGHEPTNDELRSKIKILTGLDNFSDVGITNVRRELGLG